jgi:probable rRNA maturation factor
MTSDSQVDITWAVESDPDVVSTDRIESLVRHILASENIRWVSVGIIFGSHKIVRELNVSYLEHDYNTDVLSFLIDETPGGIEGEVYVDVETAVERHVEFHSSLSRELERYVAHGVLHLAGYDDGSDDGKSRMRSLEDRYLATLND